MSKSRYVHEWGNSGTFLNCISGERLNSDLRGLGLAVPVACLGWEEREGEERRGEEKRGEERVCPAGCLHGRNEVIPRQEVPQTCTE